MLDQVLKVFDIEPDCDLNLMQPEQSLSDLTAHGLMALDRFYRAEKPHLVLLQGDTPRSFALP